MDQIEEVKKKTDMVALVGEYVELKRAGRNFKGLCPFHHEKTPSFMVNEELQIYKCFGCSKGGDAISFLMEIEGLEFGEALKKLAERAGIKLKYEERDKNRGEKDELLKIHLMAGDYYRYLLEEHEIGKWAREYLKERKMGKKLRETFGLGFSPSGWDGLTRFLRDKKGFKEEMIVKSGLGIRGKKGVYDRFRGRVMFPLLDSGGKVVGFSGRVIPNLARKNEPKYINSPETAIYHKSEMLFGLTQAKQEMRKKNQVVVVEGELDMMSSFAAGVGETVAIKGSALTEEMIERLARLVETVILALDADEAGEKAMKRSIELAEKRGLNLKGVWWDEGKDPDEIARENPGEWKKMVAKAMPVYEVVMKRAVGKWGKKGVEGVKKIVKEVVPYLAKIDNEVVREVWVKRLAESLGVGKERVWDETEKARKGVVKDEKKKTGKKEEERMQKGKKLARQLLAMLMQEGKGRRNEVKKILTGLRVGEVEGKLLGRFLKDKVEKTEVWVKKLPKELKIVAEECYLMEIERGVEDRGMIGVAVELAREKLREERGVLIKKLKEAEGVGDEKGVDDLSGRIALLDQKERLILGYLV